LQQANIGLERMVVQSIRQAPATEAPLLAWPLVCGSAVSERTRASSFKNGVLTVEVADAGWKCELQALAPRYLATINRYKTVNVLRIDFVVVRSGTSANHVR
jgi:predicted nucleic acid-binding Zn ribbon protein